MSGVYSNILKSGGKLIPKSITANGTYNAVDDNADGYESVSVNVPDNLNKFFNGTLEYCKMSVWGYPIDSWEIANGFRNAKYVSLNSSTVRGYIPDVMFRNAQVLQFVRIDGGTPYNFLRNFAFANCFVLKTVVINFNKKCTVTNAAFSSSKPTTKYYVPDTAEDNTNLPAYYRTATNWVAIGDQIFGYSEAPSYDNSMEYSIGDVCKYQNKFYDYCKKDLTSSTGNAPTGTTSDNEYWEYIADIEV